MWKLWYVWFFEVSWITGWQYFYSHPHFKNLLFCMENRSLSKQKCPQWHTWNIMQPLSEVNRGWSRDKASWTIQEPEAAQSNMELSMADWTKRAAFMDKYLVIRASILFWIPSAAGDEPWPVDITSLYAIKKQKYIVNIIWIRWAIFIAGVALAWVQWVQLYLQFF